MFLNTEKQKMTRLRDGEADTDAIPTAVLLGARYRGFVGSLGERIGSKFKILGSS